MRIVSKSPTEFSPPIGTFMENYIFPFSKSGPLNSLLKVQLQGIFIQYINM